MVHVHNLLKPEFPSLFGRYAVDPTVPCLNENPLARHLNSAQCLAHLQQISVLSFFKVLFYLLGLDPLSHNLLNFHADLVLLSLHNTIRLVGYQGWMLVCKLPHLEEGPTKNLLLDSA